MSPLLNNKPKGNRYSFDPLPADDRAPDWRNPDKADHKAAASNQYQQDWHQPAPMQSRQKLPKRRRKSRFLGSWVSTIAICSILGLTGFVVVFDLASNGKIRHLILPEATELQSASPNATSEGGEVPAPPLQQIASAPEPEPPPVTIDELPTPEPVQEPVPPPEPAAQAEPPAPEPVVQAEPPPLEPVAQAAPPAPEPIQEAAPVPPPTTVVAPVAAEPAPEPEVTAEPVPAPAPAAPAAVAVQAVPESLPQAPPVAEKPVETVAPKPEPALVVAKLLQGQVVRDCADCPELIVVSAGSFTVTNDANAKTVNIANDFAIGRNSITYDDWSKCVSDGACQPIVDDAGWGRRNRPLIFVSFDDVTKQYLPWLSKLTGKTYRLPTKDEWRYAALGGQGAVDAKGSVSDTAQECFNASGVSASSCVDNFNGTAPVGSFPPNALGLNDMKGNVWAWSADCWRPFNYAPNANPNDCSMHVLLGGAWSTGRNAVNGQIAGWEKSSKKTNSIGFRVVRSLP